MYFCLNRWKCICIIDQLKTKQKQRTLPNSIFDSKRWFENRVKAVIFDIVLFTSFHRSQQMTNAQGKARNRIQYYCPALLVIWNDQDDKKST